MINLTIDEAQRKVILSALSAQLDTLTALEHYAKKIGKEAFERLFQEADDVAKIHTLIREARSAE